MTAPDSPEARPGHQWIQGHWRQLPQQTPEPFALGAVPRPPAPDDGRKFLNMSGGLLALVIAGVILLCCIGPTLLCSLGGLVGAVTPTPTTTPVMTP